MDSNAGGFWNFIQNIDTAWQDIRNERDSEQRPQVLQNATGLRNFFDNISNGLTNLILENTEGEEEKKVATTQSVLANTALAVEETEETKRRQNIQTAAIAGGSALLLGGGAAAIFNHLRQRRAAEEEARQQQQQSLLAVGSAIVLGGAAVMACKYLFGQNEDTPRIVENQPDFERAVDDLKRDCAAYKVLGFDCKWNNYPGNYNQNIAALQLCSPNGLCVIFRLCKLNCVPKCLKLLLEDKDIAKVSITPLDDAEKMIEDWNVYVTTTFDLRFLARKANIPPAGLKELAKIVLNKDLDDELDVLTTDWDTEQLSEEHIKCAKSHAITSMELFKKMLNQMMKREVKQFYIWQSELKQYVYQIFFE